MPKEAVQDYRIRRFRELLDGKFDGNKSALGRALGYKSGAFVRQMIEGERPITEKTVDAVETIRGLAGWFTSEEGVTGRGLIPASEEDMTIPQFETGGAMGGGLVLRDQPGVIKSWSVSPEWISLNVKNASSVSNLCIVTGFGDSMRPLYNPGDPLIVDRGVTKVDFESVYFFRIENEGFIKRLQRIPKVGGGIILRARSDNERYGSFDIEDGMDFEVFGRVLKVWCSDDL